MKFETVSGIVLALLFIGILTLVFDIQPVKASATIYIRADGSVYPQTANITTADNITYTFTDNNYDSIVLERSNIVVDGVGYTLQGTESGTGINMTGRINVTIKNIEIDDFYYGIYLSQSSNNTLSGNNVTGNEYGIILGGSLNNTVFGNDITDNQYGIYLSQSSNNTLSGNNVKANAQYGIVLSSSTNNILRNNSMVNNRYNFRVSGPSLSNFVNDADTSNTVDGKPIYYWINRRDATVPLDAGYVALVNCTGITVQNLTLSKNYQGTVLVYATNSTITKNNLANNSLGIQFLLSSNNTLSGNNVTANAQYGIVLSSSSNNTISGNNITENDVYGIVLSGSSNNNTFYHNNFINNANQAYDANPSSNNWHNLTLLEGNYWSDYAGVDDGSGVGKHAIADDGIGDTLIPHPDTDYDFYPLIRPWQQAKTPLSSFAYIPIVPLVNETVTFNASASYDLDGSILSYAWQFGDGTNGTGMIVSHNYTSAGTYNVSLTVTDNDGLSDTTTKSITIGKLSSTISITASPTKITIGENATINGSIIPTRQGVNVTVWHRSSEEETWSILTTALTNESSEYSYDWIPSESGTYELKASWPGDSNTFPAESSLTIVDVGILLTIHTNGVSSHSPITMMLNGTSLGTTYDEDPLDIAIYKRVPITATISVNSTRVWSINLNSRYLFTGWVGPATGTNTTNPITITLFGNSECTANYKTQHLTNITFKDNSGTVSLDPTQIKTFAPNATLVTISSFSNLWLDNGTWTLEQVLWQGNNVIPSIAPTYDPTPNGTWHINCRVYSINFTNSFKDSKGTALYVKPFSFRLTFPNGTTSAPLGVGTYIIQNGTTTWYSIFWQGTEVVPIPASIFDATDGNPTVYCKVYSIKVEPVFYDNTGTNIVNPSSWSILFPNDTTRTVFSAVTYNQTQNGNYSIVSIIWKGTEVLPDITPITSLTSDKLWSPSINCLLPTSISISLSSSTSYVEFQVEINGNLTCNEVGLSGASILLSYSVTGGETWNDITLVTTDSNGSYSNVWTPSATGNYLVRATWSGNVTYPGTTTIINLALVQFEEQHVFSVESNSTISELAFNSTDWTLSFTVTGPDGTRGYVKATVAKSLVANIANIKVYLDESQTEYSITSTDDSWLLIFNYIHSTHQVKVDLDINIIPEFPTFLILLLFIVPTVLAVIIDRRMRARNGKLRLIGTAFRMSLNHREKKG